jgi:hypothetical protein
MKIRVVAMDGQPADMRAIGLRTVLRVIDGLAAYLVGLIVMLRTGERRGRLGDLAGKTMIVSADKPAPAPDMSAPEMPAAAAPRVPIAESGPAFAEVEPVADSGQEVASPALVELASDVSAVTDDPEREVEPEPEPEIEELPPAATLAAEAAEKEAARTEAASEAAAEDEPAETEPRMDELPSAEAEEIEVSAETEQLPSAETEETDVDEDEADEVEPDDEDLEVEEEDEVEDVEADEDEQVTVKSVETVSAIDLVMEDEEAVAGSQGKGRRG